MTQHLDERQRAMLAEMGIKVWAPRVAAKPQQAAASAPAERPVPPAAVSEAALVPAAKAPRPPAPAAPATTLRRPAPVRETASAEASELTPRPSGIDSMEWPQLEAAVAGCRACALWTGRTQTVFGVGSRRADWMVIGEAPGENEDRLGQPFVGQAGKLLDNMLAAIGLSRHAGAAGEGDGDAAPEAKVDAAPARQGVYIANVLKCRPPRNRNPQPEEIAECAPYLARQVTLVQPKIILAMGRFAVQSLLNTGEPIGRLRGRVHQYQGVPVIVTYHPAYLLRALPEKAKAWQDLCLALEVAAGTLPG